LKNRPVLAVRSVLAIAAMAALGAAAPDVLALGVGRLNVQSALGEGLRAEIDITSLAPDEASSLAVRIASPEAYRAAGVDYNAVLSGTQATVVRRADGRAFLRLSSDRAVQEPFIELIVEMSWASGRLVREFTLLFDPPGSRMAPPVQAAAPVSPVISAAPMAPPGQAAAVPGLIQPGPRPVPVPRAPAPSPAAAAAAAPALPGRVAASPAAKPVPTPRPAVAATRAAASPAAPPKASASGKSYPVRPGDTLYRVAAKTQPAGVSLDQMLVGLYRANPEAFIANNVNRLRSDSVLSVPTADEVRDVTPADLRQLITAQSVDFSAYRNRLAQGAPLAQTQEPARQAQGKVQASVDDRKQSAMPSPDKLKLSGAAASAADGPAAQPAGRSDNAARVAELSRNVEDLKKLQQGTAAVQAPAGASTVASAAATTAAAAAVAPGLPVVAPPAVAPVLAPLAAAPGNGPAASVAVAPVLPAAAPAAPAAGLFDSLSSSSWLWPGVGLLALLLAVLGAWSMRRRFKKAASETSFLESRMQPDSFFGASGGQHVDTRDGSRSGSSSVGYSLSQLDAIGDVDPVAEADVYLAYGRDLQAEEILKEAMRATPDRLAVRTKLLEVYAKRRDSKGFELLATQLYALTKGAGVDWARAQELGRQFDTDNPLYQPGGHPEEIILDGERVVVEPLGATTQPHSILAPDTQPAEDSRLPHMGGGTLDLDLDLGEVGDGPSAHAMDATRPLASSLQRPPMADFEDRPQPAQRPEAPEVSTVPGQLDLGALSLDFDDEPAKDQSEAPTVIGADTTLDFGQFPMSERGSLSETAPTTPGLLDDLQLDSADPLARKLELAEEFRQIGDIDGARDLLEEVVSKAAGTLRAKAQAMLDALT
jgi:pilus assembly protein FimV